MKPGLTPWLLLAVILLAVAVAGTVCAEPAPYPLRIRVAFVDDSGPGSFRDDLERTLVRDIRQSDCFAEVKPLDDQADPDDTLLLELRIHEVTEQTRYDVGLSTVNDPTAPPSVKEPQVEIRATVDYTLLVLRGERIVRHRSREHAALAAPSRFGGTPRLAARDEVLAELSETARKLVCRGTPRKLARELERAQASR